mmetsp:Transcript_50909/g.84369  ORF Transcript_50909/g.84369 Transcript_50909/m.84369 type:complete len:666 (+) Transcript_50909:75-2072(+)|eukprot:CAMPEP_0119312798 /NCGR_PEP_ID=MMETSP1333-20130426/27015_1 /TAXON_ID=418940 /ORGANISM="Scyphosphaera apsteinii, Strain RCC1455" /LENGTH=665 /DNA_ID=CAMNT_0007317467 /DNA_START=75 /DNA_END=2072 /DNA_ORIENTATION=-
MSSTTDLYTVLGVNKASSTETIRNAYRDLAMQHHPDRGGDPIRWSSIQRAYDTLSDTQKRATYDRTHDAGSVGAEKQFADQFATGVEEKDKDKKGGLSITQQMELVKRDEEQAMKGGAMSHMGLNMSHSAGMEAWLRNQKGLGKHGFYTAEDLLRQRKGGIEATDATTQELPPLATTAIKFDSHGLPGEVLYVDKQSQLPDQLAHGEVLVHMLASCITDEDLLRVQTPLTVLNDFPPFNRTNNKWEEVPLPAVAGVEGVGIVIATAKNVPSDEKYALEVKDWVIAKPEARMKPIGCWSTLCVTDSSTLLKVPAQMLPLHHYACARALCTAYRLLEDYGGLKPGDTIIQNGADLPVGQAVIQLCRMLKIRSINLVQDDAGFERTKSLLTELGAHTVLRDNNKLAEFLGQLGQMMPRMAIDSVGGEPGRRMLIALRPGGTLVMHSLASGQVPAMSPSLLMYQQLSLHGFNLAQWVEENGSEAYVSMLRTVSELVQADKLNLFTRTLNVADLNSESLSVALKSHRAVQDASTMRERTVLVFGDEASASEVYFELQASIRKMYSDLDDEVVEPVAPPIKTITPAGVKPPSTGKAKASERWADAAAMLTEIKLPQYIESFEEEEMTSMELLEDIVNRGDGEKELMDALKEMGIKKMGHRQAIVGAVVGKL